MTESTGIDTMHGEDGVLRITIDRADVGNSLSPNARDALAEAFIEAHSNPAVRAVLLRAAGSRHFCAGAGLPSKTDNPVPQALAEKRPGDIARMLAEGWQRLVASVLDCDKPVVAAVNGVAFAGGFLLAQQCDLVVAAEHATFAVSEVKVGRGSPWAAPLSWLVPPRVAMQILLTGDPITAERAHQVGLVNEVVPADQLRERTQQLALSIAANAPLSVLASKRTVYLSAQHHLAAAYDLADEIWEPVYLSDDAQEGPTAFREKRAPQWKGC